MVKTQHTLVKRMNSRFSVSYAFTILDSAQVVLVGTFIVYFITEHHGYVKSIMQMVSEDDFLCDSPFPVSRTIFMVVCVSCDK